MTDAASLRLGTRGSPLAVRQTEWVAERLARVEPGLGCAIERITTSGDRLVGRPLSEIGGKGVFVKEIEEAIRDGRVDAGVHSLKDVPARLPEGLAIAAVPRRENPADVLVSRDPGGLGGLRRGARVGTGSLRRAAMLRVGRSDLVIVPIRGNVETRLRRWRDGEVDAVVLASAGLRRLGLEIAEAEVLSPEDLLPAIGQGALAVEAAVGSRWWNVLARLDDPDSADATGAERAFLEAAGGDCKTPLAAYATLAGDRLRLRAAIVSPDGSRVVRGERSGGRSEAQAIGRDLAEELLGAGGRTILEALRS